MSGCFNAVRRMLMALAAIVVLSLSTQGALAECPAGSIRVLVSCVPCPSGTIADVKANKCICPPGSYGYADLGGPVVCIGCPLGQESNADSTACVPAPVPQCGPYLHVSASGCPPGQAYCCQSCPTGTAWYEGSGCLYCGAGQVPNPNQNDPNNLCLPCKGATVSNGTSQTCSACTGNTYASKSHDACIACSNGMVANSKHTACGCPGGTIAQQAGPASGSAVFCAHCPPNQVPNSAQTKCVPCPAGTTRLGTSGVCVPTKASTTPVLPSVQTKPSPHPPTHPGLLEPTPGLGTQGPGAIGAPRGSGAGAGSRPGGAVR